MRKIWCFLILMTIYLGGYAQARFDVIEKKFDQLSATIPGLNETVDLSVNGASLTEFLRGIGLAHNLNINVDNSVSGAVINNFSNARVTDVLLFLCRQYDLDIRFVGSIMSFYKYVEPIEPKVVVRQIPKVSYSAQSEFLSLELKNDTLDRVAEEITRASQRNVILAPDVKGKQVSVFIQNRPFDNALEKMALSNGLKMTKTSDNFYYLEKDEAPVASTSGKKGSQDKNSANNTDDYTLRIENQKITVSAANTPLAKIIDDVSRQLFKNYFIYNEIKGNGTLFIENVSYDEFLDYVLNGTEYTFKNQQNVYLIGEKKMQEFRSTELIQLKNRTIESVIDFIPAELKSGAEIKEFSELNGLIVTCYYTQLQQIKNFIAQVDQVVPMVMIEVILLDVKKTSIVSTGISMGLGEAPARTTGSFTPGASLNLSTDAINDLINGINGFGVLNLGNVTPEFYMNLQALEEDGFLEMKSTPKLATLNGHEASMKIGNTEYYLEVANNVIGSQNPQNIITQTWKSVNADLSVTITPFVSNDDQVTLDIQVIQSDFTARVSQNAPPGNVTRDFKSIIRAKSDDMILLGGLEEKTKNNTSSGLPLLSRVPVLKWFFGKQYREKSKAKMSIFVKASIMY